MCSRALAWTAILTAAFVAAVLVPARPAYPHKPITTNILFKNEIAQIFQRKCFQCHSDQNLGMSLTTYTEARPWARAIREEILERKMPPWTAVPGYGHFANDISLSAREIEIILSWTDGGAPSGVLKAEESIPPVFVPPAPEWALGEPDQVITIGKGHTVDAGAAFTVKRFVVATGFGGGRRVRALALKQGDRRVVRHAAFYDNATGRWLGSWTPWQTVARVPGGFAHALPARAQIAVDVGYSGADETVTDQSELGIYFDKDGRGTVSALRLRTAESKIAAGTSGHRTRAELIVTRPAEAIALWPAPSAAARSIEITATSPDGVVTPLLWVKDFRQEWQSPYMLARAVSLPKGTRLAMTTYFDNPTEGPAPVRADAWIAVTAK